MFKSGGVQKLKTKLKGETCNLGGNLIPVLHQGSQMKISSVPNYSQFKLGGSLKGLIAQLQNVFPLSKDTRYFMLLKTLYRKKCLIPFSLLQAQECN